VEQQKTVVFLYTRLPEYFYRCLEYFTATYDFRVAVIRYKEDKNTRYQFTPSAKIDLYFKDEVNAQELVNKIDPCAIILSVWSDKQYTSICRQYIKKIPIAIALDNPFTGSIKQKMLAALSHITLRRFCNRAWVTGPGQYAYARNLGFSSSMIFNDLYSADTVKFYEANDLESKKQNYPKTIVYVGRLVEYKQPHILAKVFDEISKEHALNWKLVIAGEGPLKEQIRNAGYSNVDVTDFISPSQLPSFYSTAGIFCLPAKQEHWGVAVHEAVAAGLPLLLSDTVESANTFLIHRFNGHLFKSGNVASLKKSLFELMSSNENMLRTMGMNSIYLSKRISHSTWGASLNSMINEAK
jgi:glycosyltransferase involved in cell wall biosynthesis